MWSRDRPRSPRAPRRNDADAQTSTDTGEFAACQDVARRIVNPAVQRGENAAPRRLGQASNRSGPPSP